MSETDIIVLSQRNCQRSAEKRMQNVQVKDGSDEASVAVQNATRSRGATRVASISFAAMKGDVARKRLEHENCRSIDADD